MDYDHSQVTSLSQDSLISTHKVLRNTYFLLSLTLLFSAAMAGVSIVMNVGFMNPIITLVGMFGLLFLTQALRNSAMGIVAIFAFTGFMGFILGPTINLYLHTYVNGPQIVLTTLGATGVIFIGLSAYTLVTRKDFSFLGGFLFIALLLGIIGSLAAMFFKIAAMQLFMSGFFALIASGLILFDTSRIIHNGERNYISATISLYLDIYILFTNLLAIFGGASGRN